MYSPSDLIIKGVMELISEQINELQNLGYVADGEPNKFEDPIENLEAAFDWLENYIEGGEDYDENG